MHLPRGRAQPAVRCHCFVLQTNTASCLVDWLTYDVESAEQTTRQCMKSPLLPYFLPAFSLAHRAFCASEIALRALTDIFRRLGGAPTTVEVARSAVEPAGDELPSRPDSPTT